ncbi:hypothetical protein BHM03_00020019, partial [Ensete ventricosum]
MVDFDRRRLISSDISEGGRNKKREKKRRTWRFLQLIRRPQAISSLRTGRRNVSSRGEKEQGDVVTDLEGNFIIQVGATGEEGLIDGTFDRATFNRPQVSMNMIRVLQIKVPYRSVPLGMCGTYQSVRLLVRGSPATGRYRQNRPSAVDFGRRWSISAVGSRLREKKKEERRGEEERIPRVVLTRAPSSPALAIFLPRGEKDRGN